LTPKTKLKVNNNAWFVKSLLEKNTLVVTTWRVKQNIEKLKGKQITTKQVVQLASQGWNKHRFQLSMECKELVIEILKAITNTINWRNPMWIQLCSES
jgi:hypothetical protein